MGAMQAEVFEAFRSIDVPEDKAIKAATALTSAMTKFEADTTTGFNKRDADIEGIRKDVTALKTDMAVMKWMMGTTIALLVTILFRIFTH